MRILRFPACMNKEPARGWIQNVKTCRHKEKAIYREQPVIEKNKVIMIASLGIFMKST